MLKRLSLALIGVMALTVLLTTQMITAQDDDDDGGSVECPQGQGYWKNHPAAWVLTSLPLGNQMYTQAELLVILNTPSGGDASLILAKQLIALKLNLATGTDPSVVNDLIIQADAVLSQFQGKIPLNIAPSSAEGQTMTNLGTIFEVYNHGQIIAACVGTPTPTPDAPLTVTPGTATVTPVVTASATALPPTVTPQTTPTFGITPGTTVTATSVSPTTTPQTTPASTPVVGDDTVIIIIEGPVQEININIITIYDIDIVLAPDDPILTVIQIGDIIRIQGAVDDSSDIIVIVAITVIDIDVFIGDDGTVWRDPGNCGNPPPDWAPANGWRRRCQGGGGGGGDDDDDGGGRGMGMGMGDDDDD
jgi:hypothetical protein